MSSRNNRFGRVGLAIGAGALALLGGAGVAYATSTHQQPVETGWAVVVDDCPEDRVGGDTDQGSAPGTEPASDGRDEDL